MEKYWSILAIFMNIIDPMNYILEHPNFMSCIVINLDYLIIFLNSPVCSLQESPLKVPAWQFFTIVRSWGIGLWFFLTVFYSS